MDDWWKEAWGDRLTAPLNDITSRLLACSKENAAVSNETAIRVMRYILEVSGKPDDNNLQVTQAQCNTFLWRFGPVEVAFTKACSSFFESRETGGTSSTRSLFLVPWFHGTISRREAEQRVFGLPSGAFLVRFSNQEPDKFSLTYNHQPPSSPASSPASSSSSSQRGGVATVHRHVLLYNHGRHGFGLNAYTHKNRNLAHGAAAASPSSPASGSSSSSPPSSSFGAVNDFVMQHRGGRLSRPVQSEACLRFRDEVIAAALLREQEEQRRREAAATAAAAAAAAAVEVVDEGDEEGVYASPSFLQATNETVGGCCTIGLPNSVATVHTATAAAAANADARGRGHHHHHGRGNTGERKEVDAASAVGAGARVNAVAQAQPTPSSVLVGGTSVLSATPSPSTGGSHCGQGRAAANDGKRGGNGASGTERQREDTEELAVEKELWAQLGACKRQSNVPHALVDVVDHVGLLANGETLLVERVCPCGNEYKPDTVFCRRCGVRRQSVKDTPNSATQRKSAAEPVNNTAPYFRLSFPGPTGDDDGADIDQDDGEDDTGSLFFVFMERIIHTHLGLLSGPPGAFVGRSSSGVGVGGGKTPDTLPPPPPQESSPSPWVALISKIEWVTATLSSSSSVSSSSSSWVSSSAASVFSSVFVRRRHGAVLLLLLLEAIVSFAVLVLPVDYDDGGGGGVGVRMSSNVSAEEGTSSSSSSRRRRRRRRRMELGVELLHCAVELKRALLEALPVCVFDDFNDNDSDGDDYGDDYANLDSGADAESSSAGGSGSGDGGDYSAVATATATTTTAVSMQRLSPALQPTLVLRVVEVEARCRVLGGLCHKSLATLPCDCRHAHRTHQAPPFFHALVLASRRVKPHASTVASLTAAAAADAAADTFGKDEGGGGSAEKEEEDGDGAALVVDAHWAAALGCFTDPKLRISTLAEYHNHNHNRGRGLGGGDVGRRRVHRLSESETLLSRGAAALKQSASVSLASASAHPAANASASGVRSADQESERSEGSSGSARWLELLGEAEALCWLSLVSARLAVDHLEVEVEGSQVEDTLRAAVVLEVRALANLAQVESKRKAFPAALATHRACLEVIRAAPAWIEGVLQDTRNNREAGCEGGRAKPLRIHPTDEAGTEPSPTTLAAAATVTARVVGAVASASAAATASVSLVCLEQRVLDAATKAATNAGRPRDARRLCKAHLKLVQSEENVALLTKRLGSLEAAIANTAAAASKPGARLLLEPTSN